MFTVESFCFLIQILTVSSSSVSTNKIPDICIEKYSTYLEYNSLLIGTYKVLKVLTAILHILWTQIFQWFVVKLVFHWRQSKLISRYQTDGSKNPISQQVVGISGFGEYAKLKWSFFLVSKLNQKPCDEIKSRISYWKKSAGKATRILQKQKELYENKLNWTSSSNTLDPSLMSLIKNACKNERKIVCDWTRAVLFACVHSPVDQWRVDISGKLVRQ